VTLPRSSAAGLLLLFLLGCVASGETGPTQDAAGYTFGGCGEAFDGAYEVGPVQTLYVPMRDGVRIALDVVLPEGLPDGSRVPTILTMTR
jgi:hypothetical protein